jgi:hypothetical protein
MESFEPLQQFLPQVWFLSSVYSSFSMFCSMDLTWGLASFP